MNEDSTGSVIDSDLSLPRQERELRRRTRDILGAALQMILRDGFSSFTMQSLAEATDYTRAAIYNYFPCKEDIVVELAIESYRRRLQLYQRIASFDAKPRERMVAMGEVTVILYPELFNVELLAYTSTFRDKASPDRHRQLREIETEGYQTGVDILNDAIACGDLALPEGVSPKQCFFGLLKLVDGIFGSAGTPWVTTALEIEDPGRAMRRFGSALMDGLGWQPLAAEWDYRKTMKRVYDEVFPPVLIDRVKRL